MTDERHAVGIALVSHSLLNQCIDSGSMRERSGKTEVITRYHKSTQPGVDIMAMNNGKLSHYQELRINLNDDDGDTSLVSTMILISVT